MIELNYYEKQHGKISFGNMLDIFKPNMVLCNKIGEVDEGVEMDLYSQTYVEEYDENGDDNGWYDDIYQFFIVDETEVFEKLGYPTAYSNILDVNVVGITHWGTSWYYILTNIDIKEYEERFK